MTRRRAVSPPIPQTAPVDGGEVRKLESDRQALVAADFYSALQRTLDTIQRQLSSANNPFADFVVKEFKVDAAVQMQLNGLGVLQLVLADDAMTPESISRMSLTLAAVAKMADDSVPRDLVLADATPLADLHWLPPQLVTQFAQYEIKTAAEFLGLVADARLLTKVVALSGSQRSDIDRWSQQMRLLELPSMTVAYLDALNQLGIHSLSDLAQLSDSALNDLQQKSSPTLSMELLTQWRDGSKQRLTS
jgi:hypothetical protein